MDPYERMGEARFRLARMIDPEIERAIESRRVAALVRRWHGFGTRDELFARVDAGLSLDERACVRRTFERFVAQAILVTEDRVREALRDGPLMAALDPVSALVVPTRADRPEGFTPLARGLAGHARDRADARRRHALVVFDDSVHPGARAECRRIADRAGAEYVGVDEKRRLATSLAAKDVDPALVRFAMFGVDGVSFRAGANRNCALLARAGERFVSVDDDGECRISAIPDATARLRLSSAPDPTEFWCFDDRVTALASTRPDRSDLVGVHEHWLGRSLADCARDHEIATVELDDMSPRYTERVLSGRARVAVTYLGVVGDSGMSAPIFALVQQGRSRERLMIDAERYRGALRSREIVRGVTAPTLVDSGFLMGLAIGFDNRELLPPFLPVGRNEDHAFGGILAHACGDALIGCLPFALLHAPGGARAFEPDALRFRETKLADLVRACIHGAPRLAVDADREAGLVALGDHFVALASRPALEFEAALRERRAFVARSTIAFLELLVRRYDGRPVEWARDVERFAATCEAAARDDAPIVADELHSMDVDDARRCVRALVRRYGELLIAWPRIVSAARELRLA